MQETWLNIPITKGAYAVSDQGRVRSNDRYTSDGKVIKGRILKQYKIKPRGYLTVALRIDGKTVKFLVHRLVYCTFNNIDIHSRIDVDHSDNDPEHNFLTNLRGMTRSENIKKGYNMRKNVPGYIVPKYETVYKDPRDANKKPIEQLSLDGTVINSFPSIVEAAKITGISKNNISRALRGIFSHSGGYIWRYSNRTNHNT